MPLALPAEVGRNEGRKEPYYLRSPISVFLQAVPPHTVPGRERGRRLIKILSATVVSYFSPHNLSTPQHTHTFSHDFNSFIHFNSFFFDMSSHQNPPTSGAVDQDEGFPASLAYVDTAATAGVRPVHAGAYLVANVAGVIPTPAPAYVNINANGPQASYHWILSPAFDNTFNTLINREIEVLRFNPLQPFRDLPAIQEIETGKEDVLGDEVLRGISVDPTVSGNIEATAIGDASNPGVDGHPGYTYSVINPNLRSRRVE